MSNRIAAIILAAGQGKRMNSKIAKQLLLLEDKPVIYYSIKAMEDSCVDDIVLVVSKGQVEYFQHEIVEQYGFQKVKVIIEGGAERYDSVKNGLDHLQDIGYVLIHDGARPFISKDLINELVENVLVYKACILATPIKETIKQVDSNGTIIATPERRFLWAAQTPQAFDFELLQEGYRHLYEDSISNRQTITDDAMVCEIYMNKPVKVIMGDYNNIKLTTPEDYHRAIGILREIKC